jgi:hypothetical protein
MTLSEGAARLIDRIASGEAGPEDFAGWAQQVSDAGPASTAADLTAAGGRFCTAIEETRPLAASAAALASCSLAACPPAAEGGALDDAIGSARNALFDVQTDRLVDVCRAARRFTEAAVDEHLWPQFLVDDPLAVEAHRSLPQWSHALLSLLRVDPHLVAAGRSHLELLRQVRGLADDAPSMGRLLRGIHALHDEELLVLYPPLSLGWRVRLHRITDNTQLQVLLADALIPPAGGGGDRGSPLGARPPRAAVDAARKGNPEGSSDRDSEDHRTTGDVQLPWALYAWTASPYDLAEPDQVPHDVAIPSSSQPAHIPELKGERILLLGPPAAPITTRLPMSALGGAARVERVTTLEREEVYDTMDSLLEKARAAEAQRAALEAHRLADGTSAP